MVNEAVLEFGRKHLDYVLVLEALSGGGGFDGHPTTRNIADDWALGRAALEEHSSVINNPLIQNIYNAAGKGDDTSELVNKLLDEFDLDGMYSDLIRITELSVQSSHLLSWAVRRAQVQSLKMVQDVIMASMGKGEMPSYEDAVTQITGISPALIPTKDQMDEKRKYILNLMELDEHADFGEACAKWRNEIGLLSKDAMGEAYENASNMMLKILKNGNLLPDNAKLKVYALDKAKFMGFFDYGNDAGDVYGETCMVKSDTKCVFDVVATAAHEIGGHYLVNAAWHEYAKNTGDIYGATGVMACSQAVFNEGIATNSVNIHFDDMVSEMDKIGLGMDKADIEKNLRIVNEVEALGMMALGYVTARALHFKDIDQDGMVKEFVRFGNDEHRAQTRARAIAGGGIFPLCYMGPGYYPGMNVVGRHINEFGVKDTLNHIVNDFGPYDSRQLDAKLKQVGA